MSGDQAARDSPGLGHGSGARWVAFETAAVFFIIAVLEPQLPAFVRGHVRVGQTAIANDLPGPVAASALRSEFGRDAGEKDAHRRQPLLTVDDADGAHHSRRPWLPEGEEGAAVVHRIGAGYRDREEVLNQPFDVGLTPTVPTLPARHDVLDISVQELQKLDVLGVHLFVMFSVAREAETKCKEARSGSGLLMCPCA